MLRELDTEKVLQKESQIERVIQGEIDRVIQRERDRECHTKIIR